MQLDLVNTIRAMRRNNTGAPAVQQLEREEGLCVRGIEHMASAAALESRNRNKAECVRAVLREQARQRRAGFRSHDDPEEAVRRASLRASSDATRRALRNGMNDSSYVRRAVVPKRRALRPTPGPSNARNGGEEGMRRTLRSVLSEALDTATSSSSLTLSSSLPPSKTSLSSGGVVMDEVARQTSNGD